MNQNTLVCRFADRSDFFRKSDVSCGTVVPWNLQFGDGWIVFPAVVCMVAAGAEPQVMEVYFRWVCFSIGSPSLGEPARKNFRGVWMNKCFRIKSWIIRYIFTSACINHICIKYLRCISGILNPKKTWSHPTSRVNHPIRDSRVSRWALSSWGLKAPPPSFRLDPGNLTEQTTATRWAPTRRL